MIIFITTKKWTPLGLIIGFNFRDLLNTVFINSLGLRVFSSEKCNDVWKCSPGHHTVCVVSAKAFKRKRINGMRLCNKRKFIRRIHTVGLNGCLHTDSCSVHEASCSAVLTGPEALQESWGVADLSSTSEGQRNCSLLSDWRVEMGREKGTSWAVLSSWVDTLCLMLRPSPSGAGIFQSQPLLTELWIDPYPSLTCWGILPCLQRVLSQAAALLPSGLWECFITVKSHSYLVAAESNCAAEGWGNWGSMSRATSHRSLHFLPGADRRGSTRLIRCVCHKRPESYKELKNLQPLWAKASREQSGEWGPCVPVTLKRTSQC